MAQLIVRNIEDGVVRALKRRAIEHGRSAEAEHRQILRDVLTDDDPRPSFRELLMSMPDVGEDAEFRIPRDGPRAVDW